MLRLSPKQTLEVIAHTPERLELETTYEPGGSAPPAHLHRNQDEHFEVLEGAVNVTLDGAERTLQAGDTLDVPRGTVHQMWNGDGAEAARVKWVTTPAGRTLEWLAIVAIVAAGNDPPKPFDELLAEFADTFALA